MILRLKRLALRLVLCFAAFSFLAAQEGYALDKKASATLSHYIMAVIYDDLGQVEKAIQEYKEALRTDYENTVIHLNLSVAYIKSNQLDKAAEELSIATRLDPEAVEPHAILALLYSLQNKTEESNREYELALTNASKINPKNIEIYRNLGELYLQQNKLKAAESMYKIVIDFSPDDASAHYYLANIYELIGDKQRTEEELKKCLKLKPDYHEALNYLGYFYVEGNTKLGQAEKLIKKALELDPDNGAYVDSLGWLYFKKGNTSEAQKMLRRAVELLKDPVIYDHLGDVYFKLGEIEKANASWEDSLKLDSQQPKVKDKIKNINKPKIK